MKNQKKFKELMATMGELYDKPVTALLSTVYWKVLEPFSDDECEAAFKQVVLESKFFPRPAELVEILQGKKTDQAAVAWIKVVEGIRQHGEYVSVSFDDPVIHAVIEFMGGWPSVGTWPVDELKWKQKEFERLYVIMQRGGKFPDHLPGVHELANGADVADVIMIGDRPKRVAITGG